MRLCFDAIVSSEEVPSTASRRPTSTSWRRAQLDVEPDDCVAVEDSTNGINAAVAARMRTIAVPTGQLPPADDVLKMATVVVSSLAEVTPDLVASL